MKKIKLIGISRYFGYLLIAMQGILLVFLTVFFLNKTYMEAWNVYPDKENVLTVYLKNIAPEKENDVQDYLLNTAASQNLFLIRKDRLLQNDGTPDGFLIGIYGNASCHDVSFSFLGQQIVDSDSFNLLLNSENAKSTLGVEFGSIHSIGKIPSFRFYEHVVIKQLPSLIHDTNTAGGTYSILGFVTQGQISDFIRGLSVQTGLSEAELLSASGGEITDRHFMLNILLLFLGAQIFLNIIFFLVIAVKSLPRQGKLTLLGWSRTAFAWEILGSFLKISVIGIPFFVLFGLLLCGWTPFSAILLFYFLVSALLNLIIVGVELLLSASVILMTKALNAIRGRIPKKPFYLLGILAYLLISAGIVFCGCYVDQPLLYLSENAKLSRQWQTVSDYQILQSISIGWDADSFTGGSNQLDRNIYEWYRSIADQEGVYLIHTNYYDEQLLTLWRQNQTYSEIPENPFWYFTVSPNYLEQLGLSLEEELLAKARGGMRLYLLPDTFSETQRSQIAAWLMESSSKGIQPGDIPTSFSKEQHFCFLTYTPNQELFTWATTSDSSMTDTMPVIYVATPENMRYFETESLKAAGLESYIKFADENTKKQYTQPDLLNLYDLSDNNLTFTAVQNYIDGIQKSIWVTLLWFGLVFVILLLILIGLLLTLAAIFRIVNQEKINIKKFLGFSFFQLYRMPILLLSSLVILEFGIMIVLHSKFGSLLIAVSALLQFLIFVNYMARSEWKRLRLSLKGESL